MMTNEREFTAPDADGKLLREYDDVELMRPAVFTRCEGARIHTRVMPAGSQATIIMISDEQQNGKRFRVLHLESVDGVFFNFELGENVRFVRTREKKLENVENG